MTGGAYDDPVEHLLDHLVRLAIAIDRLAAALARDAEVLERVDAELATYDAAIAERVAATPFALPIEQVATRFGLGRGELHLLLAAALPGLDIGLAARWRAVVGGDEPERAVYQLVDLLEQGDAGALVSAFGPDAPLRRRGLVRLVSGRAWTHDAPVLQRLVLVPDAVIDALRGEHALDPALAHVVAPCPPASDPAHPELAALIGAGAAPVVVVGPAVVGKATAIATAAAASGRGALVARLDAIAAQTDATAVLGELACLARLRDDVLVLRAGDDFAALPLALRRRAIGLVAGGDAILTARDRGALRELAAPRVVELAAPTALAQLAMWRDRLGDGPADLAAVVTRCALPIGDIVEAAAILPPAPATEQVVTAARARLQHRLGEVAQVVATSLEWSDLVVRDDVSQRIFEIVAAVRHRDHVMTTWGFGAKLPYGRSISALLAGPPGTGKTMVATLIAKDLGLELFRVDLSKVVSKWMGETEKNLAVVFDEAARCGAVLLFDEADALFGKRTEVKSSNDRNANLEVNYLLQRLEQHDGVVLLTTNLGTNIDPAFARRLRFRIEFPAPEVAEREALWRTMIPARAPLAPDVDLRAIANRFAMAGGHIKNAVVRAAFLAAERDAAAIDHATLVHAAALEWTELGNLPV